MTRSEIGLGPVSQKTQPIATKFRRLVGRSRDTSFKCHWCEHEFSRSKKAHFVDELLSKRLCDRCDGWRKAGKGRRRFGVESKYRQSHPGAPDIPVRTSAKKSSFQIHRRSSNHVATWPPRRASFLVGAVTPFAGGKQKALPSPPLSTALSPASGDAEDYTDLLQTNIARDGNKASKASIACVRCREKEVRCSSEIAGCQRCLKACTPCEYSRARSPRAQVSTNRTSKVWFL